ncbi:MAG: hypothetical protein Q8J78_08025 [Moraxellaceae bacterium]|nr:hypothetical protein [Moraxellaceae bacterium]
MKTYLIKITTPDNFIRHVYGIYSDGFEAVIAAMCNFPDACRISARRLP